MASTDAAQENTTHSSEPAAAPAAAPASPAEKAGEEGGKRTRKRKSLWDTTPADGSSKGTAGAAVSAAGLASPDSSASLLLQQQQQLMQLRALAQAKAEAAAALQAQQAPMNGANRVYVGSIFYDLTETDMLLAFSPFGQIIKIDMPKDASTGKHKGFCFIEYTNSDSATAAIATMDGCQLAGRRIKVNRPTNAASSPSSGSTLVNPMLLNQAIAMSPVAAAAAAAAASVTNQAGTNTTPLLNAQLQAQAIANTISIQHGVMPSASAPAANTRVYVGSIVYDLGESDVMAIFQAFGNIKSCQLIPNPETGKHKGYGFVEFDTEEAAKGAIQCMNGFQLGGRQLKVGWASATNAPSTPGPAPAMPPAMPMGAPGGFPGMPGSFPGMPGFPGGMPGMPGMGGIPGMGGMADPNMLLHQQMLAAAGMQPNPAGFQKESASLEKEENLSIGRDQRVAMMQRMSGGTAQPPAQPASEAPGRCILLNNMVGPEEVDDDLQSETTDECGKFGKVEKVVIYQEQRSERPGDAVVKIFVLFSNPSEASAAKKSLDGRWFGGRQVQARSYPEAYFVRDDFTH